MERDPRPWVDPGTGPGDEGQGPGDEGQGPGDEGQGPGPEPKGQGPEGPPWKKAKGKGLFIIVLGIFLGSITLGVGLLLVSRTRDKPDLTDQINREVASQVEALNVQGLVNKAGENLGVLIKDSVADNVAAAISAADISGQVKTVVAEQESTLAANVTTQVEAGLETVKAGLKKEISALKKGTIEINGPAHKAMLAQIEKNSEGIAHLDQGLKGQATQLDGLNTKVETHEARLNWLTVKTDALGAAGDLSKTNKKVKDKDVARRNAIYEAFLQAAGYNTDGTVITSAPPDTSS